MFWYNLTMKNILDVCCGGRMFWFDKNNKDVLFLDNRVVRPVSVGVGKNARIFSCRPDLVMDFRDLKFSAESFQLVVFDPPHFINAGPKSYMALKYGLLNKKTYRQDLEKGFSECFRVLKKDGFLIFKWNDTQILTSEILKLAVKKPLFGHKSGKLSKTHWLVFQKK